MTTYIEQFGQYSPALTAAIGEMNEAQQQVCRLNGGLAAVIGCPGSGKTRALINLLARSVADGLDPARILAMTFTRAAAHEMNDRLKEIGILGARVGTIHSVCQQILSESGLTNNLMMDERNYMGIELKKCLADMRRASKIPKRGVDKDEVAGFIASCKARGCAFIAGDPFGTNVYLSDAIYAEAVTWRSACGMHNSSDLAAIYHDVEKRRNERGLYGFDDMLLWAWMALLSDNAARIRWAERWSTIITDETQDSNPVQWDIARMLTGLDSCILSGPEGKHTGYGGYIKVDHPIEPLDITNSLYVFADPSQSIYKFRAAVPELFVEFAMNPEVEMIALPMNYRSTPAICDLGTKLVKDKSWHLCGEMIPSGEFKDDTTVPSVVVLEGPQEESEAAVRWAMKLAENSVDGLNDCAILARTSMMLHLCEMSCIRQRLPYRKMASGSFFDSKEAKDVLSYLSTATSLATTAEIRRTANTPFRYISKVFLDKCVKEAYDNKTSLIDVMMSNQWEISPRPRRALQEWFDLLQDLNAMAMHSEQISKEVKLSQSTNDKAFENIRGEVGPAHMIVMILRRTDYIESLRQEEGLGDENSRIAALNTLQRIAEQFLSPVDFLNYVLELRQSIVTGRSKLARKEKDGREALTLSTIHRSKALEWKNVRIVDVMHGRFPHAYAKDKDEELRLLYVAVTRAKQELVVSANLGDERSRPSEYICIIQNKLVVTQDNKIIVTDTQNHCGS